MRLIKIIQEHILYKRFLQDLIIILLSNKDTFTPKYPFHEVNSIVKTILEYKEKAKKYDELISSNKAN